jgi:N-acetyl-anhydromuramoyl-L-alanine amidase
LHPAGCNHQLCEVRVRIGADHWLEGVERCPSPNCDARPDPDDIVLLVIHNISLPPRQFGGEFVKQFFTNCLDCSADVALADLEGVRVSAHLFVDRRGAITQFVPFDRRAWHAGQSSHAGRSSCNDFSIGVELEGTDDLLYEDRQYQVLAETAACLARYYPRIPLSGIVGHEEIAPIRKTDPGPSFDWGRLYRDYLQGIGSTSAAHRR